MQSKKHLQDVKDAFAVGPPPAEKKQRTLNFKPFTPEAKFRPEFFKFVDVSITNRINKIERSTARKQ